MVLLLKLFNVVLGCSIGFVFKVWYFGVMVFNIGCIVELFGGFKILDV